MSKNSKRIIYICNNGHWSDSKDNWKVDRVYHEPPAMLICMIPYEDDICAQHSYFMGVEDVY